MNSNVLGMITIIVPVFSVEQYLPHCITSILNQTYTNLEILLIDDGSQDKCGVICEEYAKKDSRVRVFHTENRGLAAARNLGLKEAKGEYIGFVDSDDWVETDMYRVLLRHMQATDSDVCICGFWSETVSCTKRFFYTEALYNGKESLAALINGEIGNYTWNKLYRKELFKDICFPVGKYYEDVVTICAVLSNSRITVILDMPLYHYRQRSDSITYSHSGKNLFDYADAYLNRFFYLKEHQHQLFVENEATILSSIANSFFRVWRWWYGCTAEEKVQYADRLDEYVRFSREHFPVFGLKTWPISLRLSSFFIRRKSSISLALLYYLNQLFRYLSHRRYSV